MANETVENGFKQASTTRSNAPYFNDLNAVMKATFVIAAGVPTSDVCTVQVTVKDSDGIADLTAQPFMLFLSDSATGVGITSTTASGDVVASVGTDFGDLTAKKVKIVQPNALGVYTLSINDSAKTGFYIAIQNQFTGQVIVSRQLVTADYG